MPAAAPPMTTRQAKRQGKKSAGQFRYTASQMRRADRREELEERRRKEQEKERKKKENKRKRDEQDEKERVAKRRLLREGKIAEEDTWGKVSASQPRLNNFFKAPATVKRPRSAPVQATHKEVSDGCDSQEETLVDNAVLPRPEPFESKDLEYISDQDLLQLVSSQSHHSHPTPPDSFEDRESKTTIKTRSTSQTKNKPTPRMLERRISLPSQVDNKQQETDEFDDESFPDFEVAEDETAEPLPSELEALNDLTSLSPSRSPLSEMSVANVNTRAQEKPDTTSAPAADCGLQSPPSKRKVAPESTQVVLALMADEDFEDDDDLVWEKENTDPLNTTTKEITKQSTPKKTSTKDQAESSKKTAIPGFGKFEDCEDIFDFDFEAGEDDFDDEVDDAMLMAMAATQKPKSDRIINAQGSPKKLSPRRDAFIAPAPLEFTPRKSMAAPPPNSAYRQQPTPSKNYQPSKLCESFSSVAEEDLLVIADQVEEELSQKKLGKRKENIEVSQTVVRKSKRSLPWVLNPLPPPNTQDYLLELAEEVEAEMEGE